MGGFGVKIVALRELIKDLPDDAEFWWEDPNFGGRLQAVELLDVSYSPESFTLYIRPIYWEACD
jgi:hypothetical protein